MSSADLQRANVGRAIIDPWHWAVKQAEDAYQSRRYLECFTHTLPARRYIRDATSTNTLQQTAGLQRLATLARYSSQYIAGMNISGAGWRITDTDTATTRLPLDVSQQLISVSRTPRDNAFTAIAWVQTALFSISPIHGQEGFAHLQRESTNVQGALNWDAGDKFEASLALVYGFLHGVHLRERARSQWQSCEAWLETCREENQIDDAAAAIWRARLEMAKGDITLNLRSATRCWGHPSHQERLDNEPLHRYYLMQDRDCAAQCTTRPDIVTQIAFDLIEDAHTCYTTAEDILRPLIAFQIDAPREAIIQSGECFLRHAFLLVSQAEASAPRIERAAWVLAQTKLQTAADLFIRARCVEGRALCIAQIALIDALLDPPLTQERHVPLEWQRGQTLYQVSRQVTATTSMPCAVSLGHFCANVGRRWLTIFGQAGVAYRCHTLAVHIFDGAEAAVAQSMSIATRSALCFEYGPKLLTVDAIFTSCESIRRLLNLRSRIATDNLPSQAQFATCAEQVLRSLDAYLVYLGTPIASEYDKALAADTISNIEDLYIGVTEFRNSVVRREAEAEGQRLLVQKLEAGHIGNLRAMIGLPEILPPLSDLVPPSLLRYAQDYTAEARWLAAKIRFQVARSAGQDTDRYRIALLALCSQFDHKEDGGIVPHYLMARYHLLRQEYEEAIQRYLAFLALLLDWQAHHAQRDEGHAAEVEAATLTDACTWFWYCHHADRAALYLQRLHQLQPNGGSWLIKAVAASSKALLNDRPAARRLYEAAISAMRDERHRAHNWSQRLALHTDEDILRALFGAALLYIDPRMDVRPEGQGDVLTQVYANDQHAMEWCMHCLELTRANVSRDPEAEAAESTVDAPSDAAVNDPLMILVDRYQGSPLRLRALMQSVALQQAAQRGARQQPQAREPPAPVSPPHMANIEELQRALPQDALLLIYSFFDTRLVRIVIPAAGNGQAQLHCMAIQAYALRRYIHQLLEICSTPDPDDPGQREERHARAARACLELANMLFSVTTTGGQDRVVKSWPSVRKLFIVPHGELHGLPFDVLPIEEDQMFGRARADGTHRRLVHRFDVRFFPSSTLLLELLQRTVATRPFHPADERILLVGNPEQDDEHRNREHASREVREIDERIDGDRSVLLIGAEATTEAICDLLTPGVVRQADAIGQQIREANSSRTPCPPFRYVHFACHALVNETVPSRSALVLADGECLYAGQIQELDLRGATVFVNACSSAETIRLPGQDMVHSIAHAFLRAGASCVLANLWPVVDRVAIEFALASYHQAQEDESPTLLLRRQLANDFELRSDLHAWAPLVIHGLV